MSYTSKYADGEMRKAVRIPKKKKPKSKGRHVSKGTFGDSDKPAGKYKTVTRRSGKTISKTKTSQGKDKVVTKGGKEKVVVKKKGEKRKVYKNY